MNVSRSKACLRQDPALIGPLGDNHVGHQIWASKLAQANGVVGSSLAYHIIGRHVCSMSKPTLAWQHAHLKNLLAFGI